MCGLEAVPEAQEAMKHEEHESLMVVLGLSCRTRTWSRRGKQQDLKTKAVCGRNNGEEHEHNAEREGSQRFSQQARCTRGAQGGNGTEEKSSFQGLEDNAQSVWATA